MLACLGVILIFFFFASEGVKIWHPLFTNTSINNIFGKGENSKHFSFPDSCRGERGKPSWNPNPKIPYIGPTRGLLGIEGKSYLLHTDFNGGVRRPGAGPPARFVAPPSPLGADTSTHPPPFPSIRGRQKSVASCREKIENVAFVRGPFSDRDVTLSTCPSEHTHSLQANAQKVVAQLSFSGVFES